MLQIWRMRSFLFKNEIFSFQEVQDENTVSLPEKQLDNKIAFYLIGKKESDMMWCVDESAQTRMPVTQKKFNLEVTAILCVELLSPLAL